VESKAQNRIWKPDYFRVFLSHKTEVKNETANLKVPLELFGISYNVIEDADYRLLKRVAEVAAVNAGWFYYGLALGDGLATSSRK
jgi:hypothetical protein